MWAMMTWTTEFWITVRAETAELAHLRRQIHDRAVELGADAELVDEFLLAVCELATNVVMHTDDERVEVRLDRDVDSWVLDVGGADGLRAANPSTPPDPRQIGGRGLFIVNTVMDDVAIVTGPSGRLVRCVKYLDS